MERLTDDELRRTLTAAVAEYSHRVQAAMDDGRPVPAALDRDAVTPTDVLLTARHMLDDLDIAAFELGMVG